MATVYWNRTIQTDHQIEAKRPDIIFLDLVDKTTQIINIGQHNAKNDAVLTIGRRNQ